MSQVPPIQLVLEDSTDSNNNNLPSSIESSNGLVSSSKLPVSNELEENLSENEDIKFSLRDTSSIGGDSDSQVEDSTNSDELILSQSTSAPTITKGKFLTSTNGQISINDSIDTKQLLASGKSLWRRSKKLMQEDDNRSRSCK